MFLISHSGFRAFSAYTLQSLKQENVLYGLASSVPRKPPDAQFISNLYLVFQKNVFFPYFEIKVKVVLVFVRCCSCTTDLQKSEQSCCCTSGALRGLWLLPLVTLVQLVHPLFIFQRQTKRPQVFFIFFGFFAVCCSTGRKILIQ